MKFAAYQLDGFFGEDCHKQLRGMVHVYRICFGKAFQMSRSRVYAKGKFQPIAKARGQLIRMLIGMDMWCQVV
jgi:hypothetical protein